MELRSFQRRFAKRVRALREACGLRQDDFEEFGLSWKAVQKLEYGITDPKVSSLLKLCDALEVDLPELLRIDEAPPIRPQAEALHDRPKLRYGEAAKRKKKKKKL